MQALGAHSLTEAALRRQLTQAFRLASVLGLDDTLFTHMSVRLPDRPDAFLINPFGVMFDAMRPQDLAVVEGHGARPNIAGTIIHGAVLAARPDVNCVVHLHTPYGMAVAAQEAGLLPLSQNSCMFYGRLPRCSFGGIAIEGEEGPRIAEALGEHKAIMLDNHGMLTATESIPSAFMMMYYLERACMVQIKAMSGGGALRLIVPEVAEKTARQFETTEYPLLTEAWSGLVRRHGLETL